MSDIPKLGSKDQLPPNGTTAVQTGRNGLVTFFPSGTDQNRPAVISINGDNGGIDIGGTREKHGKLLLRDKFMTITYIVDGEKGETNQSGDIVLFDANGNERVRIRGKTAEMVIKSPSGDQIIHLDGKLGDLTVGGMGQDGDVIVRNSTGGETIRLDGNSGEVLAGGNGQDGDVSVRNAAGGEIIRLNGNSGEVIAGGNGQDGDVVVRNAVGNETIRLNGDSGDITAGGNGQDGDVIVRNSAGGEIIRLNGNSGEVIAGGNGQDGDVSVRNSAGNETIRLDGNSGDITAGGNGQDGDVIVKNLTGGEIIRLNGNSGEVIAGGNGQEGDVSVRNSAGNETIRLDGSAGEVIVKNSAGNETILLDGNIGAAFFGGVGIGITAPLAPDLRLDIDGKVRTADLEVTETAQINGLITTGVTQTEDISVTDGNGNETIYIDGVNGDIRIEKADCAEDFDIVETEEIEPGTVMVFAQEGKLRQSREAYDKKVAGVISGAGDYKPGIILDQQRGRPGKRLPVALMGKVYCKADASYAPIEIGDILTTSYTPGYAMKASDSSKALGTIIGKALQPLESGQGLIPILVALQ